MKTVMHVSRAIAVITLLAPAAVIAQSLPFDVVAISRNTTGSASGGVELRPGGRIVITNTPLRDIIRNVYSLPSAAVVGGPEWLVSERYDIVAMAAGEPSREQWMLIMRALLADRFELIARLETRDAPSYHLLLARADRRLGPQMTPTTLDCEAADRQQAPARCGVDLQGGSLTVVGRPISRLIRTLGELCGRLVVDRTNLDGLYDLTVRWKPDAVTDRNCASLSAALQEQLGLKLQSAPGQAQVLVIEHAERPIAK